MEGEFFQALFKIQAAIVDVRKRFVRLAAQLLDAGDEQAAFAAEHTVDCALRAAGQLNNFVDRHAFVAVPQKQVRRDLLELAISYFSTRSLYRHSSSSSR